MSELSGQAHETLREMALECSVQMDLWNRHSNAVLSLTERIDALEAEIERLKDELKVNPCALLGKCVGPSMTKDGARLVAENARLREALSAVEPYLDGIICYASTMKEYDGNRVAALVRAALGVEEESNE